MIIDKEEEDRGESGGSITGERCSGKYMAKNGVGSTVCIVNCKEL